MNNDDPQAQNLKLLGSGCSTLPRDHLFKFLGKSRDRNSIPLIRVGHNGYVGDFP